ncbi:GHKL domain-containing protein [Erysipelatoclostridium ramosum]|uniref:sensor histidine kinase n=1 Tax=Thomasclavelia ramosa TaxID=1547 RepID=UPI00192B3517|nr:GHKL domain-containing protein [Thomasclavelia ramosa]MCR1948440.1 GHKL domain-containing protein [Thomasclavelia ramosa]QQY27559.1 GHKL domain-containing protein [Thomasclavelia ramosa]
MTSWIILLIKQYIDIINYLVIGNSIFKIKYEKHKKIREIKILSLVIFLIYVVLCNQIKEIWIDLNALICLITVSIIFRCGFLKTVKIVVVSILITTLLEQFIGSFISYDLNNICSFNFIFSNSVRFVFIMFTAQIINFIFNKTNLLTDLPGYIYVNMIFGFSATMFPLFVVQTYKLAIKSRLVIVTTAIAYINIVISLISIFMFIRNRNEKNQYYLDSIMKDKTLKLQEDYYKKIIDNYSNIRKFKHDIKGHLAVVNELINSKNYDEANVYIGNMSEAITGKDIYNTNNIYISSILNSFDQSFIDNKIEFDLSYYIISDLKMNSMDICSLFYNLILNAVEANLKIEDKRFIKLYIANIKNNVLIKIVNPVNENFNLDIIKENKTTKEDKENHGFGLITINNIISKYNGNIDYSIHNQYLIADITILNVL